MTSTLEDPGSESIPPEQEEHHRHPHLHHFRHSHNGKRRMLQFIHPQNGKTVHVAHSPSELAKRRQELLKREKDYGDFDVVLHGSPEHIEAIQLLHASHSSRQERLRQEYAEAYEQFDTVRDQLDLLNAELHLITDHSVALDASFDKYGYSAHLRTIDHSETSSLNEDHPSVARHQDRSTNPLKFFKRPQIRQYFHKGLVWRSSRPGEVASFELFIDLVYVGVIDAVGELAVENPSGLSFLHFFIAFYIAAKVWSDMTMVINWFDIDDVFQRIAVAFTLVCLFGYTTNISYMFRDNEATYKSAIAFYMTQRLNLGVWYGVVAWLVPMIKGTMILQMSIIGLTSALWIGSMHATWPHHQLPLICIAMFFDLFGGLLTAMAISSIMLIASGMFITATIRKAKSTTGAISRFVSKYFEFLPAVNIEHRVERNNTFVALVFGYSILTILFQSRASFGINAFFGKGILGLLQAFAFNWIYFEIDNYGIHVHAIRRSQWCSYIWILVHLPFVMGYVLSAATLSRIVLAHDCSDANPDDLAESYQSRSVDSLDSGLRWFYCGGLGVALISMAAIALTHQHKKLANAKLRKWPRLCIRCGIGVTMICLPLAKELSSLDLVAITSGLTISVLIIDLYGNIRQGHSFWQGGLCVKEKKKTTYAADFKISRHQRKELQRALEKGEKVGLKELLRRHSSLSFGTRGSATGTPTRVEDEEWHGGHY